jgi:Na+/proline symporter
MPDSPEIDLRQHARQTRARMVRIGLLLIVAVGLLLIGIVYGWPAAGVGAVCMGGALLGVGAVAGVLWLIQYVVTRSGYDD